MGSISYFQRYSQKENHVTNNTMLMLQHVYRTSPRLLEAILRSLLDEDVEIGPSFNQQIRETVSIPDAALMQLPLNIYIETKRGSTLDEDQLERHIRSIKSKNHPSGSAVLIGLTTDRIKDETAKNLESLAKESSILFTSITYSDLITSLREGCEGNGDLLEVVDDYHSFISGEGLIPGQYRTIAAVPCRESRDENLKYGVYFEPAERKPKWKRAEFIGIYKNKTISHIGRIVASASCRKIDGALEIDDDKVFNPVNTEHENRILGVMGAAHYYAELASYPHRYYIVDHFSEVGIRKTSPMGLRKHQYFDIGELAGKTHVNRDMSSEEAARILRGTTFQ